MNFALYSSLATLDVGRGGDLMDKKIAGLIGAVSALAAFDAANAATAPQGNDIMKAASYDDLLQPIPNALELLKASDTLRQDQAADNQVKVEMAQYYYHHHHHHRYFRPYYHHHHHHHYYYHHHHHHYYAPY